MKKKKPPKKKPKKRRSPTWLATAPPGTEMEFDTEVEGPCPCGGTFTVGEAKKGGEKVGAVVHSIPFCEEFAKLGPGEYLTFVRRSFGLPEPQDDEEPDNDLEDEIANALGQPAGEGNVEDDMIARLDIGKKLASSGRRLAAEADRFFDTLNPKEQAVVRRMLDKKVGKPLPAPPASWGRPVGVTFDPDCATAGENALYDVQLICGECKAVLDETLQPIPQAIVNSIHDAFYERKHLCVPEHADAQLWTFVKLAGSDAKPNPPPRRK